MPASRPMRALTLAQPWASLVALGVKTIETRSWSTSYRGPLAIHAAKSLPRERHIELGDYAADHDRGAMYLHGPGNEGPISLPLGAVVATCTLAYVMRTWAGNNDDDVLLWARPQTDDEEELEELARDGWWVDAGIPCAHVNQKPYGDYSPGRFAWFLEETMAIDPVPMKGKLGLWHAEQPLPWQAR